MLLSACSPVLLARPSIWFQTGNGENVKGRGDYCFGYFKLYAGAGCTAQPFRKKQRLISRLVDELDNDKVGMIVFAGDAFTQLPITGDYISAKCFGIYQSFVDF